MITAALLLTGTYLLAVRWTWRRVCRIEALSSLGHLASPEPKRLAAPLPSPALCGDPHLELADCSACAARRASLSWVEARIERWDYIERAARALPPPTSIPGPGVPVLR